MKQSIAIITAVIFYLGSLSLIDSAIARDHDHDKHDRKPMKMLFHNIDMSEDQRTQVKEIMQSSFEQGKELRKTIDNEADGQRNEIKTQNREALSAVLNDEQMSQFDKNAKRIAKRNDMGRDNRDRHRGKMDKKGRMKGGKHNKGGKHKKGDKHKKGQHQRPHQE